jgi:transposase
VGWGWGHFRSSKWLQVGPFQGVIPSWEAANEAVAQLADAYQAAGVNLGSAITSFCRWGPESLNFHAGERATNAASEGANGKIEVLERMAYGFRSRANYVARVLVMCSGHPPALSPP